MTQRPIHPECRLYEHVTRLLSTFQELKQINKNSVSEEEFDEDFIRLIYHSRSYSNDPRIFSTVESRAARLNMFNTGKYSDVTLIADDGEIKAHRILLAAGSELMNAMLIGEYLLKEVRAIKLSPLQSSFFIGIFLLAVSLH